MREWEQGQIHTPTVMQAKVVCVFVCVEKWEAETLYSTRCAFKLLLLLFIYAVFLKTSAIVSEDETATDCPGCC